MSINVRKVGRNRKRGATLTKYLVALVMGGLLIGFYLYQANQGVIGSVAGIKFNTAGYIIYVHQDANGNDNLVAVSSDGTGEHLLTNDSKPKR